MAPSLSIWESLLKKPTDSKTPVAEFMGDFENLPEPVEKTEGPEMSSRGKRAPNGEIAGENGKGHAPYQKPPEPIQGLGKGSPITKHHNSESRKLNFQKELKEVQVILPAETPCQNS